MAELAQLHFLRPLWLLALAPAALLVWQVARRQDTARVWYGIVAGHLLPHLLTHGHAPVSRGPLRMLAVVWAMGIVALAGPSWQREPSPFAEDIAALVIVVEVTPTLRGEDVQPDRLTRAMQKIHDLLALRAGAKTALIAYAGSAHLVMPLTRDGGIIDSFAGALDPDIMPDDGDAAAAALALGERVLAKSGQAGSLLWITDGVAPEQRAAVAELRTRSAVPLRVLAPVPPGTDLDALRSLADEVITISADDRDVRALAAQAKFAAASAGDQDTRWQDAGYWFTPLIALLALLWFRSGWVVRQAS